MGGTDEEWLDCAETQRSSSIVVADVEKTFLSKIEAKFVSAARSSGKSDLHIPE